MDEIGVRHSKICSFGLKLPDGNHPHYPISSNPNPHFPTAHPSKKFSEDQRYIAKLVQPATGMFSSEVCTGTSIKGGLLEEFYIIWLTTDWHCCGSSAGLKFLEALQAFAISTELLVPYVTVTSPSNVLWLENEIDPTQLWIPPADTGTHTINRNTDARVLVCWSHYEWWQLCLNI